MAESLVGKNVQDTVLTNIIEIDTRNTSVTVNGTLTLKAYTSTERDAISPVVEGMMIFNTTTDTINLYDGSSWGAVGGGVSSDPLTTKGDVFTYDTGDQRLAVGTNTHVLTADSAEATGIKWAAQGAATDPLTTKGDLFTFDTDAQRLAVGTNDFVLTADSAEATGLKWAAVSSDPLTTKGDLFTFDTDAQRLAVGTNTHILTADSAEATGIKWAVTPSTTPADNIQDADNSCNVTTLATAETIIMTTTSAERMRIDSSGFVGVGTNDPKVLLHIVGDATDSNQPTGLNGSNGETHTGLYIVSDGKENGEKYCLQLGGADGYTHSGISGFQDLRSGNTRGDICFEFRAVNTDTTLTERVRFQRHGWLSMNKGDYYTAIPDKIWDINSTTSGVLFPRMTTTQRNAMTAVTGEIMYNTTTNKLNTYTGSAWEVFTSV